MSPQWINKILAGLTNTLSKFVSIFKKNGFVYSLLAMLALVCFYTLIINPIRVDKIVEKRLESMYQTEKTKEAESVNKRIEADRILGNIMSKIVEKFPEVQRILLLESHNSVKTLTGTDILYMSCTMEMLTPNSLHLTYLSEDLQRQIRHSLLGQMLNSLKYKPYIYYPDVKSCNHPDHKILWKLKQTGDKEALLIPYLDKEDNVQIVMIISGENLPVDDIVDYTTTFRKQIEACLM